MASPHEGIHPHLGADLLKAAMMSRSEEDGHDQIGSATPTPSGIHTPRPDLTDKRLPGILHTYFGQVGSSQSSPVAVEVCNAESESVPAILSRLESQDAHNRASDSLVPTVLRSLNSSLDICSHDLSESAPRAIIHGCENSLLVTTMPYPTPPRSSSNSSSEKELGDQKHVVREGSRHTDRGKKEALQRPKLVATVFPLRAHHGMSGPPSLSAISTADLPVAILSNPASLVETCDTRSSSDERPSFALNSLTASLETIRLTEGVAEVPCEKSTPPHTPRSLSQAGPSGSANDGSPLAITRSAIKQTLSRTGSRRGHSPAGTSPVGPPKGKLSVRIIEARGLRPSSNPYIVSVFEGNEYISNGPRDEEVVSDKSDTVAKDETAGGFLAQRSLSEMSRSLAIPMKSRQSSTASLQDGAKRQKSGKQMTDPRWDIEATFDVVGQDSTMDVFVYDYVDQESFLGHLNIKPEMKSDTSTIKGWYKLGSRPKQDEQVSGEIYIEMGFQKTERKHYGPDDFSILKLIGKGTFGQVYQVRKKDTQRIYAMKVLSKKVIVQKKEVAHTLGERNILVRTAMADSPFIVGLKFSFQTPTDLYLVTDFMSGGELFWHLQKEGRFNETRAKFYIAELILALQHLHQHNIVYRDLKPENILLDANGHIALCDFGLSKANLTKNDTTNTFCGTTEYLAPEVLLDEHGYTAMVDFWSLGVLVFEMCCGWSPFYAEDTQQMYKNIAFGKVRFPRDALSVEGRNFVKGLLNRNPRHRLGANNDAEELKQHPFFADVDWEALARKEVIPPFKPKVKSNLDVSNFDPEFTNALENSSSLNARAAAIATGANPASTPLSPGIQANFKGFTFVDESNMDEHFRQDAERMEEDGKFDEDWEQPLARHGAREDRMSGVVRGNDTDAIFNNGPQFDEV